MFIGIDPSLSETAVTIMISPTKYQFYTFQGVGVDSLNKIIYLHGQIKKLLENYYTVLKQVSNQLPSTSLCFIEGGAFHGSGRLFTLGQLSGIILAELTNLKISFKEIPPSLVKEFITGKGMADKKYILKKIKEKYNISIKDDNDNIADSYVLALMAYRYGSDKHKEDITFREELEVVTKIKHGPKKVHKTNYQRRKKELLF